MASNVPGIWKAMVFNIYRGIILASNVPGGPGNEMLCQMNLGRYETGIKRPR